LNAISTPAVRNNGFQRKKRDGAPDRIAERIGVSPTLTAIFAVTTAILGAIFAPFVLNSLEMKAWWQRGFPIGVPHMV
jgi:hypothetical protein